MRQVVIFFLRVYQLLISPLIHTALGPGTGCRYRISCSEYAINSLKTRGVVAGAKQSVWRILNCI